MVSGEWSESKIILKFTGEDINKIKSNNIDIIVRCGLGILKGEILSSSKFGVISFHHGDNRINRGGPSGFWEVLNNEPSSGFIIQRLTEELDGGPVLFRGNIMTSNTWLSNNDKLLSKSYFFMKRLLLEVALNDCLPNLEAPTLHDRPLYKINSNLILLKYICKVLIPILGRRISSLLRGSYIGRWSIAYAKHDNFNKSLWRYKEIENPRGRFLADPFVFKKNGRTVIFAEDYFFNDSKGRISAIEIKQSNEEFLGVVLEEDFHLSFPYIFESEGIVFMIPESSNNKDIRLYECIDFPTQWKLKAILMKGISAADTMVFKKFDKWFMLTNICSAGVNDHQSELHIFWSSSLESSEWVSIKCGNPVIFHSESARNGGFFIHDGSLYRINQIHGKYHYGKGFGINIINVLDEFDYKETRLKNVEAHFKKNIFSSHHFNAYEDIAVVDYCRSINLKSILSES